MQATVTPPPRGRATGPAEQLAPSPLASQLSGMGGSDAGIDASLKRQQEKARQWRDKAHRLGDLIVRQEAENLELQRQLGALQRAQAAAVAAAAAAARPGSTTAPPLPGELEGMRRQLLAAQAQLEKQTEELEAARADYDTRQTLLKQAAGAARQEVLALQASNRELRGEADRLSRQAEALTAQLRASQLDRPRSAEELLGSAGPSPAKRHTDVALLQAMLRKKDGELSVLREDSESQQEELMRTLSLLQAAHKREGDLRRQVDNLEGQLDITRDELGQKDAHLELLRERQEEQQDGLHQLRAALVAAEEQAAAATAAAHAAAGGTEASESHVAQMAAEAAALRQRCQREEAELEHTRQQLQQRDAEVAQLRLQVPDLRSQLAGLRDQLSAAEQTLAAQHAEAAEQQAAQQAEAAERQASLQREVEEATAAAAELRVQLERAQAEREQLAAQAAEAAAALEQQQEERSEAAADAAKRAALEEQLSAATERLSAVQQQLEAAEAERAKLAEQAEEQAAGAQQRGEAAAAGQEQLAAAAADRDVARRQLHRLQGDVSDAEVLLASVLGGCSGSLFSTPPHSPGRGRHTPGSSGGNEAGDGASAATAVQWLQRQHSASPPPSRASGAAAVQGAGTSRLCHRIQAVVAEVQRLQAAEQQRQREGTASAVLSPEDSAAVGADDAGSPLDKLPLLSPVHSDATSSLIPAVHAGTPSQAAAADGCSLAPSPAASSKLKAALQQEAQQQQQQQQQGAKARSSAKQQRPKSAGKRRGGGPIPALIRTAGLAGIGAAVALQLLRPR